MESGDPKFARYGRQMRCEHLGQAGQRSLAQGRALIVGVGGLGSWAAELLARAGVGLVRLADDRDIGLVDLQRQGLYAEADVGNSRVEAAAARLRQINADVTVEPVGERMSADSIAGLADGVDVIVDGCDNFAERFIINDYAVRHALPWVFAGVVAYEAQTMTIVPNHTACLRCVYESPPPDAEITRLDVGVMGPAVAAISAIQTAEAMKILTGRTDAVSQYLLKLDLWTNKVQRIDTLPAATQANCPCCTQRRFEFLAAPADS